MPASPTDGQVFQFQVDLNRTSKRGGTAEANQFLISDAIAADQGHGQNQNNTKGPKLKVPNRKPDTATPIQVEGEVPVERAKLLHNEARRLKNRRLKELGLCRECGKPAVQGQARCDTCAEKNRQHRRQRHVNNPTLCRDCSNSAILGKSRCENCSEKRRLSYGNAASISRLRQAHRRPPYPLTSSVRA